MPIPADTTGCTVITATGKVISVGTGDKGVLIVDDTGTVPVLYIDETSDEETVNLYVDLDPNAALFKPGDDPTTKMVSDYEILRHRRPEEGNVMGGFPKHRAEKSAVLVIVREGIVHSATTVRGTEDEINDAFIQTCKQNGLRKDWDPATIDQEGADDGPNLDDGYWKPSWDGSINLVWPQ